MAWTTTGSSRRRSTWRITGTNTWATAGSSRRCRTYSGAAARTCGGRSTRRCSWLLRWCRIGCCCRRRRRDWAECRRFRWSCRGIIIGIHTDVQSQKCAWHNVASRNVGFVVDPFQTNQSFRALVVVSVAVGLAFPKRKVGCGLSIVAFENHSQSNIAIAIVDDICPRSIGIDYPTVGAAILLSSAPQKPRVCPLRVASITISNNSKNSCYKKG